MAPTNKQQIAVSSTAMTKETWAVQEAYSGAGRQ